MKLSREDTLILSEIQLLDSSNDGPLLPEKYLAFLNDLQEALDTNKVYPNEMSAMLQVHDVVGRLLDS